MSDYGSGNITALFGGQPFDPNAHEPSKDFEVLPPGKYTCLIESAELRNTQKGTGKLIKVTLKVVEGLYANRKLFDNINVRNPSADCQRMGIAQLSSIGRAAECYPVDDTANLVDKVVIAVVKVKKREDTNEDKNDVRTYESPCVSANAQHAPAVPPSQAPCPQSAAPQPVNYMSNVASQPAASPPVMPTPPFEPIPVPPSATQPASAPPGHSTAGPATIGGVAGNAPWKQ